MINIKLYLIKLRYRHNKEQKITKMHKLLIILFISVNLAFIKIVNADEIYVAAASSLTHVLKEIAKDFENETQHNVKLSFASSGTLAHQIIKGAPFELFLSADINHVSLLHENKLTGSEIDVFGMGYLVLYIPNGSSIQPDSNLSNLSETIQSGNLKRLAIANPKIAPYGLIAKQALNNAQVWELALPYIVYGKSASQTAQFILTGTVDAALIPYSLAQNPKLRNKGKYVLINKALYPPLKQPMVLMGKAGDAAKDFYKYLLGDKALAIFQQHGFGTVE